MRYLRSLGIGFSTLLIYLGLTLFGWGLNHIADFFVDPARSVYALVVVAFAFALSIQAFSSLEGIQDSKGVEGKTIHRQTIIGSLLVITLFVSLIALPYLTRRDIAVFAINSCIAWVGVLLCLFGYVIVFWSGLALGRQYSAEVTIQENHQLITSGPFQLIRHPRYTGIICLSLGFTLLFHTWVGFFITLLAIGLIIFRVYDEENLLRQEFGIIWEEYQKRTKRFIPFIY